MIPLPGRTITWPKGLSGLLRLAEKIGFFGSSDDGDAGTILLSLVQTCRGLGSNPKEYLEDVMRRIMGHSSQKLHELLPDEWLKRKITTSEAIRMAIETAYPLPQAQKELF